MDRARTSSNPRRVTGFVRLIGIDPGLRHTGWGVIEVVGHRMRYVASGRISPVATAPLCMRLGTLGDELEALIADTMPEEAAVEETFVNADPRSALKLGQARGVCLAMAGRAGLPVAEYAPNAIKKAVVGSGHAGKEQVAAMVARLLPLPRPVRDDEADALAVAICHSSHRRAAGLRVRA